MTPATPTRGERLAVAATVLAGVALLVVANLGQTFASDDFSFLLDRGGLSAGTFLVPHNEHLSALPIAVYRTLMATVGTSSYWPYQAVALVLHVAVALLVHTLARRRVGPWAALAPTAVVLALGPAWQDLVWAFQIGYLGATAAGLAAWTLLDRPSRRNDGLACAALVVGLLCSSIGVGMVVGAAVWLLAERAWRRGWIVVVPTLAYGLWYLGYGVVGAGAHDVGMLPAYVVDAAGAALTSIVGLGWIGGFSPYLVSPTPGRTLVVVTVVAGLVVLARRRRLGPLALAAGGGAIALWLAAGWSFTVAREPEQVRYQYASVVLVLLVAVSSLEGARPGRRALAVLGVATAAAVAANAAVLLDRAGFFRETSAYATAELGAMQLARGVVSANFVPQDGYSVAIVGDHNLVPVTAGPYFARLGATGLPGSSEATIAGRPDRIRRAADLVSLRALLTRRRATRASNRPGCRDVTAQARAGGFAMRAGTLRLDRGAMGDGVALRRFAAEPVFPVPPIAAGASTEYVLAADASSRPWRVTLTGPAPARLCLRPSI